MSGEAFEFPFRDEDFVEKLIRDHPELEPWRDIFSEYATTSTARDEDLEDFLAQDSFAPGVGLERSAVQSIPNGIATALSFDMLNFQSTDVFTWDAGTPTKIVVGQSGIVTVTGNARFLGAAGGVLRFMQLMVNGITEIAGQTPANPNPNEARGSASVSWPLVAGDYIELVVQQDSGGALDVKGKLQVAFLGKVG